MLVAIAVVGRDAATMVLRRSICDAGTILVRYILQSKNVTFTKTQYSSNILFFSEKQVLLNNDGVWLKLSTFFWKLCDSCMSMQALSPIQDILLNLTQMKARL